MDSDPIVVLGPSKEDVRTLRGLGVFLALGTLFFAVLPGGLPLAAFAGAMALLLMAPMAYSLRRSLGRGAVLDDEGVGPALDGERTWTLPWSQYGGYRPARPSLLDALVRPDNMGYEILDRGGQTTMILPLTGPSGSAILAELDLRTPPDGFPYDRFATPKTTPRSLLATLAVAVFAAAVMAAAIAAGPLSPLFMLAPLGGLGIMGGVIVAGFQIGHLVRQARGAEPLRRLPPRLPEEGPVLERHLTRYAERPIRLEEGQRYRTVDPERRRAELRLQLHGAIVLARLSTLFPLIALVVLAINPERWQDGAAISALNAMLPFLLFRSTSTTKRLLRAIDDVLWVHEGTLIVVRPDGTTLRLPLPDDADTPDPQRDRSFTDVLRSASGERYVLDRTRLYAAPTGAEELHA